jgi:hypothetical protein
VRRRATLRSQPNVKRALHLRQKGGRGATHPRGAALAHSPFLAEQHVERRGLDVWGPCQEPLSLPPRGGPSRMCFALYPAFQGSKRMKSGLAKKAPPLLAGRRRLGRGRAWLYPPPLSAQRPSQSRHSEVKRGRSGEPNQMSPWSLKTNTQKGSAAALGRGGGALCRSGGRLGPLACRDTPSLSELARRDQGVPLPVSRDLRRQKARAPLLLGVNLSASPDRAVIRRG